MEQEIILTDLSVLTVKRRTQIARLVSNIFSPPILGVIGLLILAQTSRSASSWLWILFYISTAIFIPVFYVVWLLLKKEITDFHIRVRYQRLRPMFFMVVSSVFAWIVMRLGSAPVFLQTIAILGAFLMMFLLLITLRWKISGHTTAATAFAFFSLGSIGSLALPVLLLIPLVIWARVTLKRHTLAQTIAGTLVGGIFIVFVQYGEMIQNNGVL
jgi:membrane-associated phospholipid phosphatase